MSAPAGLHRCFRRWGNAMRFENFAGNPLVKETLSRAVDSGRIPHALLLEGPKGSGKKTLAHLIAQAAVCTSRQEKPCGECAACRKAETGHADISVYRGDGTQKSLSVDMMRTLRDTAAVLPNEAEHKVALILDADCMGAPAQNALLKVLEEPPAYMVMVITAVSRSRLLPTVCSRCICLSLQGVEESEALAFLKSRLPLAEDELLARIRLHGGCIGAVLESEQEDTALLTGRIAAIAGEITSPQAFSLLAALAPLERDKPLTDAVLSGLLSVFRDALALNLGAEACGGCAPEVSRRLSRELTAENLMKAIEAVQTAVTDRTRNMNQALLCTLLCARLREAAGR